MFNFIDIKIYTCTFKQTMGFTAQGLVSRSCTCMLFLDTNREIGSWYTWHVQFRNKVTNAGPNRRAPRSSHTSALSQQWTNRLYLFSRHVCCQMQLIGKMKSKEAYLDQVALIGLYTVEPPVILWSRPLHPMWDHTGLLCDGFVWRRNDHTWSMYNVGLMQLRRPTWVWEQTILYTSKSLGVQKWYLFSSHTLWIAVYFCQCMYLWLYIKDVQCVWTEQVYVTCVTAFL